MTTIALIALSLLVLIGLAVFALKRIWSGSQVEALHYTPLTPPTEPGRPSINQPAALPTRPAAPPPPAALQPGSFSEAELIAQLRPLLMANNKIAAIKLVRKATNMGLKEAKEYVEQLLQRNFQPTTLTLQPPQNQHQGMYDLVAEVRALLGHNQKIQAVKLVRERTAMDLKEALDFVEAIPHSPSPPAAIPVPQQPTPPTEGVNAELQALLARGQKIQAIKLLRERTGMGLKEAKDYVEAL